MSPKEVLKIAGRDTAIIGSAIAFAAWGGYMGRTDKTDTVQSERSTASLNLECSRHVGKTAVAKTWEGWPEACRELYIVPPGPLEDLGVASIKYPMPTRQAMQSLHDRNKKLAFEDLRDSELTGMWDGLTVWSIVGLAYAGIRLALREPKPR